MTRSNIQLTSDLLHQIHASITSCERCPRLRDYCRGIGEAKRRAYQDQTYWARPVPGFGDPLARILILGLATKPRAIARDDGLKLRYAWIASVVRCAPPGDKPLPQEIRTAPPTSRRRFRLCPESVLLSVLAR